MALFLTSLAQPNEVVKAEDINVGFTSTVDNVAKLAAMIFEADRDFVIGGKVTPYTGNDMNIAIAPIFGVCHSTSVCFGSTETISPIAITPGTSDRIDIVEVKGEWVEYDEQQRAFKDFDTDTKTYQNVNTKQKLALSYQIKQGTAGSAVAPEVDSGYVKIAEIHVSANAEEITADDIYNITADIAGNENEGWTTEQTSTYNVGYISEVNERFREEHNADGSHKDNIIGTDEIDSGTGSKQIGGHTLPTGGELTIGNTNISATNSIYNTLVTCAALITDFYAKYKKLGYFAFNGEVSISSLLNDDETALVKALVLGSDGDGTAYIKLNGTKIMTIQADGRLTMLSSYNPLSSTDLVTKATTDSINLALTALTARVTNIENTSDNTVYSNGTLSTDRYTIDRDNVIYCATTENIDLKAGGLLIIDGVSTVAGVLVLVKNQDDATENGFYEVSSSTSWERTSAYATPSDLTGKLWHINNGSVNKGKIFYVPKVNFIDSSAFGSDKINFLEHIGSVNPIKDKIAYRDETGHLKSAAASSSNDVLIKQDLLNLIYPIGTLYWSSKSTNPSQLFGGTWTQIKDRFILAAGDTYNVDTTGGNATVTLTTANMPSHSHSMSHTHSMSHSHSYSWSGSHSHSLLGKSDPPHSIGNAYPFTVGNGGLIGNQDYSKCSYFSTAYGSYQLISNATISVSGTTTSISTSSTGSSSTSSTGSIGSNSAFSILPPYVVKYCFERTA